MKRERPPTPSPPGIHLFEERLAAIPDALRLTAAAEPPLPRGIERARGIVTTGVGSSRAQARLLAHLLADRAGLDARFAPLGALAAAPPPRAGERALVVFSQGLSPNAWLPLAHARAWRHVVVVTAATERTSGERAERFRKLARIGADVVRFAGDDEFGLLVRVIGPMCGMLAVWSLARRIAAASGRERTIPALDVEMLISAIAAARRRVPKLETRDLDADLVFLASGGYGELADNLRMKLLEGLLVPMPPVWDLLDFAHGPFQQALERRVTFLLLARGAGAGEAALVRRLEAMLDGKRHRLVRLGATLPGELAMFEHEAQVNEILRRALAERGADPAGWPGRGRDRPLYGIDRLPDPASSLEASTWPEVERAIASGRTTLVVPLGAIEQHGPHLPLATDAWIAHELAERLCRRFPDAIAAPVLALGCSSEHGAFPGTLSLEPETLERVLLDLLAPLHRHGFGRAFVFSAHGGNVAILRAMLLRLRAAVAPLAVVLFDELDDLARSLHAESARFGVGAEASGHHAGELETSILLGTRPDTVRADRLAAGFVEPIADPQSLFYPSLRDRAPSGVVGDPRHADAARADAYLEAWVDRLAATYVQSKTTVLLP